MLFIDPAFRVPKSEVADYSEAELKDFKSVFAAHEKCRPGAVARGCLPCVWFLLVGGLGISLGDWLKVAALVPAGVLLAVWC